MSRYSPQRTDIVCLLCPQEERTPFPSVPPILDHLASAHQIATEVSRKATGRLTLALDAADGYSNSYLYSMDGKDIMAVYHVGGVFAMTDEEREAEKERKTAKRKKGKSAARK